MAFRQKALKSEQEILDLLQNQIAPKAIKTLANEAKKVLYNNILVNVYRVGKPTAYDRTGQFLKAVTAEVETIYSGNIIQARIYIDTNKLRSRKGAPGKWPQHKSVATGQAFKRGLLDVLNDGMDGPLYSRDGAYFIEDTIDWLEKTFEDTTVRIIRNSTGASVRVSKNNQ